MRDLRRFGKVSDRRWAAGWLMALALELALGLAAVSGSTRAAASDGPDVVVSVLPVHSLVAMVMDGVGTPHLLVRGAASPHSFSMRPSDARAVARADLVVWVGPALESFLPRLLRSKPAERVVTLMDDPAVTVLAGREGGVWAAHDHETDGEDEADRKRHGDPHLWLDPENARAIVRIVTARLAALDPAHASAYLANAVRAERRLRTVEDNVAHIVSGVRDKPFIVFHDAYHYFEARFGLRAAGSITVGPERKPGAKRVRELRDLIAARKAACVFAEPQFEPDLVATLVNGTGARSATLDPLGAGLTPGSGAYETLLMHLAKAFRDCLAP